MLLYELNYSLFNEKVSANLSAYLKRQGLLYVQDILEFYPTRYQDRRYLMGFPSDQLVEQSFCLTQQIKIIRRETFVAKGQNILKLCFINQEGEEGSLLCFNRPFLAKVFPIGSQALVYGSFSYSYGQWASANFDIEKAFELKNSSRFGKILPFYRGQTQYSSSYQKFLKRIMERYFPVLEEDIPAYLKEKQGMCSLKEALKEVHFPESIEKLQLARETLEKREVFFLQAGLVYQANFFKSKRIKRKIDQDFLQKSQEVLPFFLSEDQKRSLQEIYKDLESEWPMQRLLQGDVGSGKTLVAFLSALGVLYAGEQVAIMAPTELLARQHLLTFERYWSALGFEIAFLSGSLSANQKKITLERIQEGSVQLVVGTHALFSQSLKFYRLGYVIIDEQQKFGLAQREKLREKGLQPDVLLMSATPIPRTMALALMGVMPVSVLYSRPKGRMSIQTLLVERTNRERIYAFMQGELAKGRQAYIVHPVIEDLSRSSLPGISELFEEVEKRFAAYSVSLLHSRLKEEQKVQIMENFVAHKLDILVSTSMVEVGMDVANATVMLVSGAENFGLASLHQLRGRVGRSEHPSYCFLLYTNPLDEIAKKRLKLLRESEDGFYLAEQDLKMRGSGDFICEKQSGKLALKLFTLETQESLFASMQKEVARYFDQETVISEAERKTLYGYLHKKLCQLLPTLD